MATKDFKTKREIVVKTRFDRKNRAATGSSETRTRGVFETRRDRRYLPRRTKVSDLVNFYDCGQLLVDGLPTELDFVRSYTESYNSVDRPDLIQFPPFAIADRQAMEAQVLSVGLDNLKDSYQRIELDPAAWYGVDVNINQSPPPAPNADIFDELVPVAKPDTRPTLIAKLRDPNAPNYVNTRMTADGMEYEPPFTSLKLYSFSLTVGFDTLDTDNFKVTGTNDFNDDAIEINTTGAIDIFMLPKIHFTSLETRVFQNPFRDYLLNAVYNPVPRSILLNKRDLPDYPLTTTSFRDIPRNSSFVASLKSYWENQTYTRVLFYGANTAGTTPRARISPPVPVTDPNALSEFQGDPSNNTFDSSLLAVIDSASQRYFVWSKTNFNNLFGGGFFIGVGTL